MELVISLQYFHIYMHVSVYSQASCFGRPRVFIKAINSSVSNIYEHSSLLIGVFWLKKKKNTGEQCSNITDTELLIYWCLMVMFVIDFCSAKIL